MTRRTEGRSEAANLGLGCGNPVALASLQPGQTVLDLGSGAGFDAFLAAKAVGPSGRVIGVDMTAEMISKARRNKAQGAYTNIEFRLGEIEHLPVADGSVDAILSNCVINLSPDKAQVFREAYTACGGGAALVEDVEAMLRKAGFAEVRVEPKPQSREVIRDILPGLGFENHFTSASIEARKPDVT